MSRGADNISDLSIVKWFRLRKKPIIVLPYILWSENCTSHKEALVDLELLIFFLSMDKFMLEDVLRFWSTEKKVIFS